MVDMLFLYSCNVAAGFPSPADDYMDTKLDLNELIIQHKEATFFMRAQSSSMQESGIFPEDILVVDRRLVAKHGKIVVVTINGEFFVKRICKEHGKTYLLTDEDDSRQDYSGLSGQNIQLWGVVSYVIHQT